MNASLFLHLPLPCPVRDYTETSAPVARHPRISGAPLRGLLTYPSFFSQSRSPFTKLGRFSYEIKGKERALLPTREYGWCFPRPTYLPLHLAQVPYSSLHSGTHSHIHTHAHTRIPFSTDHTPEGPWLRELLITVHGVTVGFPGTQGWWTDRILVD